MLVAVYGMPQMLSAQNYRGERSEWVLQIGGVNDDRSSHRIAVDRNGDAVIAGTFTGTLQLGAVTLTSNNTSFSDVFIAKVSPSGSVLWAKQLGGKFEERIFNSHIGLDSKNALYISFYTNSESVDIAGTTIQINGTDWTTARILKLSSNGDFEWLINDKSMPSFQQGASNWTQVHVDSEDNLIVSAKQWCGIAEIRKYSSRGELIYKQPISFNGSDDCATPRVQGLTTDAEGNIYAGITYNKEVGLFDTSFVGKYDLIILKLSSVGAFQWAREIKGPAYEAIFYMSFQDGALSVCGSYGWKGQNNYDETPVEFGGKTIRRSNISDGFIAKYSADGELLQLKELPYTFGMAYNNKLDLRVVEKRDSLLIENPGDGANVYPGLVIITDNQTHRFYTALSYNMTNVCGSSYLTGEFKDTLQLDKERFPLVSRGGKDIFLALMKPPGKYVPAQTGLRSPVNGTVDVDIPTKVDWWWVRCSNGYRLQVSTDTSMSAMVLDTIIAPEQEHTLKNLAHSTKYYWRVRANTADTFGLWSGVASFTTVKSQPADVVLESPSNKSIGNVKNTTLRWRESKRATSYIVDIATDSALTDKVISGKIVGTASLDVVLEGNTTYYWRVRAGNSTGTSPWSEVWSFQTRPNRPSQSVLISPPNESTGEVVNTHFVWQAQNPNEGFTLQIARDSVFTFKEREINLRETAWRDTLEANTTYYWRVRASNVVESGDWSETWSFGTGTTLDVDEESASSQLRATYTDGALLVHLPDVLQDSKQAVISMYDVSGRTVISATNVQLTDTPVRVVVPRLARGTYMVQLTLNGGKPLACSVVVE